MQSRKRMTGRAFTLIELLVVIGIIAVLVGIALAVGNKVINTSRAGATKNTIQLLETYLSDLDGAGAEPKSYKAFSVDVGGSSYEFPVVDGRDDRAGVDRTDKPISSLMRFIAAGDGFVGDSAERWGGLDSSVVRSGTIGTAGSEIIQGVELTDQWGNPIRVVHPAYDGGFGDYWDPNIGSSVSRDNLRISSSSGGSLGFMQVRRSYRPFDPTQANDSVGDADEGICTNERVYFYSAGEDGDPGTREDNVYSVRPRFPAETEDF